MLKPLMSLIALIIVPSPCDAAGSIFGMGAELNTVAASVSLMAIIGFTVLFEVGTLRLDRYLKETPYKEMIDKIYRELAILGFISFGVFLTLQSGSDVNASHFLAFEFSHIVIFFAALCFVASAVCMMIMNKRIKVFIDQVAAKTSTDCIKDYEAVDGGAGKSHGFFGTLASSQVEYKLYNTFFCYTHKLPMSAFDFGMYMREVLDEHVVDLIEVEISSWIILIIFLGLNVLLIEVVKVTGRGDDPSRRLNSFDYEYDYDYEIPTRGRFLRDFVARKLGETSSACGRRLGESTSDCTTRYLSETLTGFDFDVVENQEDIRFLADATDYSNCCCKTDAGRRLGASPSADPCAVIADGMEYALILGWCLVVVVVVLNIMYRRAEIEIRKIIGCPTLEDACDYIKRVEREVIEEEEKLLDVHMRKKLRDSRRKGSILSKGEELIGAIKAGEGFDHLYSVDGTGDIAKSHEHHHEHDPIKNDVMLTKGKETISVASKMIGAKLMASMSTSPTTTSRSLSPHIPVSEVEMRKREDSDLRQAQEVLRAKRASSVLIKQSEEVIKDKLEHLRHKVVVGVYKKLLDLIMLFNCFYLAVFFANFSLITLEEENLPGLWFTASLLPGFITLFFCGKAVKTQGIIGAITSINLEVVEKVINETEEIYATGKEVFHDFKAKLDFLDLTMADVEKEFAKIDEDGSGDLSFKEFRKGLVRLGIHFHGKRGTAKKLFRLCDADKSGTISFQEFAKLIFPERVQLELEVEEKSLATKNPLVYVKI